MIGWDNSVLWLLRSHDLALVGFLLMGLCKELCLYGETSRPESFGSKSKKSLSR
jgi:hypothetical protein